MVIARQTSAQKWLKPFPATSFGWVTETKLSTGDSPMRIKLHNPTCATMTSAPNVSTSATCSSVWTWHTNLMPAALMDGARSLKEPNESQIARGSQPIAACKERKKKSAYCEVSFASQWTDDRKECTSGEYCQPLRTAAL